MGGPGWEFAFQGAELLPNIVPITPGTMTDSGFCLFVSDVRHVYLAYLQPTLSPVNWRVVIYCNANAKTCSHNSKGATFGWLEVTKWQKKKRCWQCRGVASTCFQGATLCTAVSHAHTRAAFISCYLLWFHLSQKKQRMLSATRQINKWKTPSRCI